MARMKLCNRLEKMSPDHRIKIGCKNGSGFVFAGTVKEFLENKESVEYIRKQMAMRELNTALDRLKKHLDKFDSLEDYRDYAVTTKGVTDGAGMFANIKAAREKVGASPMEQRTIIEEFPSIEPGRSHDTTIIMVFGADNGEEDFAMPPLTTDNISPEGAVRLFGAMWKEPTDQLTRAYFDRLKNHGSIDESGKESKERRIEIRKIERSLTPGVVKTCEVIAKREYKKWLEDDE